MTGQVPPNYFPGISGFGQPQQASYFPSIAPGQQGMQAGWEQPSYGGISGLSAAPPGSNGGGIGSWMGRDGYLSTGFAGIQALGGAYLGFQNLKLAKDNLKFNKQAYNTNLTNSTQDYNTKLEDRINGRTSDYAGKQGDVQAYLATHQLKKPGG